MFEAVRRPLMFSLLISSALTFFPPWTVQIISHRSANWAVPARFYAGRSFLFGDAVSNPVFHSWMNDRRIAYSYGSQSIDATRLCCEIAFVWFAVFGVALASRRTIQNWFSEETAVTERGNAGGSEP